MQKLPFKATPAKFPAKSVLDFSGELQLLERIHSQLRTLLPAAAEAPAMKDAESDDTLSFSSRETLSGLLLYEHQ